MSSKGEGGGSEMNAAQLDTVLQFLCFMRSFLGKMDFQCLVTKMLECSVGLRVTQECKITPVLKIAVSECKAGQRMLAVPAGMVVGHLSII